MSKKIRTEAVDYLFDAVLSLKSKEEWPLSLYLPNISTEQAGRAFAASMLVLLPAVLVFLAGQDYLEQGIISTAVKE